LSEWLAIAVGLAGGVWACYWTARLTLSRLVARSRNPQLLVKLSLGGTVIAAIPAVLLSIVVGATLGMPWGLPGMAAGVGAVSALVLLSGTFLGAMLAALLTRPGA
jgi:hypothetical protein